LIFDLYYILEIRVAINNATAINKNKNKRRMDMINLLKSIVCIILGIYSLLIAKHFLRNKNLEDRKKRLWAVLKAENYLEF
jgi:hypothetical protein